MAREWDYKFEADQPVMLKTREEINELFSSTRALIHRAAAYRNIDYLNGLFGHTVIILRPDTLNAGLYKLKEVIGYLWPEEWFEACEGDGPAFDDVAWLEMICQKG